MWLPGSALVLGLPGKPHFQCPAPLWPGPQTQAAHLCLEHLWLHLPHPTPSSTGDEYLGT